MVLDLPISPVKSSISESFFSLETFEILFFLNADANSYCSKNLLYIYLLPCSSILVKLCSFKLLRSLALESKSFKIGHFIFVSIILTSNQCLNEKHNKEVVHSLDRVWCHLFQSSRGEMLTYESVFLQFWVWRRNWNQKVRFSFVSKFCRLNCQCDPYLGSTSFRTQTKRLLSPVFQTIKLRQKFYKCVFCCSITMLLEIMISKVPLLFCILKPFESSVCSLTSI